MYLESSSYQLLRTNSVKASSKRVEVRLYNIGYPHTLVQNILATIQFSYETAKVRRKQKQRKFILRFVTT